MWSLWKVTLSCYQCMTYICATIVSLQLIFIGPFKVLKCIGKLAFHTELLPILL